MAIAEEGLRNPYGANIGKTLLKNHGSDLSYKMRAYAAAASDARMNGCEKPVIINSGSGNQGITTSVPVVVYAREKGLSREELLRVGDYDYVVYNQSGGVEAAAQEIRSIIAAEKASMSRHPDVARLYFEGE